MTDLDTKPSASRRRAAARRRWLIILPLGVVAVVVFAVLTIPTLLTPPPSVGPGYDLPVLGEASAPLVAGSDVLLETADGAVSVYVPAGAYPYSGTLVIQTRRPELVPFQMADGIERVRSADVLVLNDAREVVPGILFTQQILVCFRLDEALQALREQDPSAVTIDRFNDRPDRLAWEQLEAGPGWEAGQMCASVDHLSLFALSVRRLSGSPTPQLFPTAGREPTPEAPGLYSPFVP